MHSWWAASYLSIVPWLTNFTRETMLVNQLDQY